MSKPGRTGREMTTFILVIFGIACLGGLLFAPIVLLAYAWGRVFGG